jgi:hypothetical protein
MVAPALWGTGVGFVVHLVISAIIGMTFGVLFSTAGHGA